MSDYNIWIGSTPIPQIHIRLCVDNFVKNKIMKDSYFQNQAKKFFGSEKEVKLPLITEKTGITLLKDDKYHKIALNDELKNKLKKLFELFQSDSKKSSTSDKEKYSFESIKEKVEKELEKHRNSPSSSSSKSDSSKPRFSSAFPFPSTHSHSLRQEEEEKKQQRLLLAPAQHLHQYPPQQ